MEPAPSSAVPVGPNAITQMGAALVTRRGWPSAARIYGAAGMGDLLTAPPTARIPEDWVARLHRTVHEELPVATARALAWEAGRRTADYLLAWRIPYRVQRALVALPVGTSARLLVAAIGRNAWTFVGSGRFAGRAGRTCVLTIAPNPLAVAGCPWHSGVFARLFEGLVAPEASVTETACCARGDAACRFEVRLR